ncbi:putative DNA-binding transcriptional regulator AlpA [Nonomuraea thailandensis]|uniref:DNA-binding transcriptional regulator AlpA n=1 Tax=Nonomuraea thailandensis TaxID=1188745 RepID=A0A9X2KAJ7_9ACTN|nr:excisionase [Nonomuraea thailandensis]MCP2363026.1 putative DNA-binding transcriptional regulator AlpA [Nonomuraea thailandensis]
MSRRTAVVGTMPDRRNDRILRMPQIEELTQVPQGTLRYYRHLGRVPWLRKIGGRLGAWESDVYAWIEAQE